MLKKVLSTFCVINLSSAGQDLYLFCSHSNGTAEAIRKRKKPTEIYYSSIWHSYLYLIANALFDARWSWPVLLLFCLHRFLLFHQHSIRFMVNAYWTHVSIYTDPAIAFMHLWIWYERGRRPNKKNVYMKENLYAIIRHICSYFDSLLTEHGWYTNCTV